MKTEHQEAVTSAEPKVVIIGTLIDANDNLQVLTIKADYIKGEEEKKTDKIISDWVEQFDNHKNVTTYYCFLEYNEKIDGELI